MIDQNIQLALVENNRELALKCLTLMNVTYKPFESNMSIGERKEGRKEGRTGSKEGRKGERKEGRSIALT